MKNQFLNLGKVLSKSEQKTLIGGGELCPLPENGADCYAGPYFCNTWGLPRCITDDFTN